MKMVCADVSFLGSGWLFMNLTGVKTQDDWFILSLTFLFIFIVSFIFGLGGMALFETTEKFIKKWNGKKMLSKPGY